jgi:hypothetical protein
MKKLTEKWLRDLRPCADGLSFAESCGFDFAKIYDTCEQGDWLFWLLKNSVKITQKQSVILACECAKRVLVHFEKEYPKDMRPREAIDAALLYVQKPTAKNKSAARSAAWSAARSAESAARSAAWSAESAAWSAAWSAESAARSAARSAAWSAARSAEQKWQADKIRETIKNPFK